MKTRRVKLDPIVPGGCVVIRDPHFVALKDREAFMERFDHLLGIDDERERVRSARALDREIADLLTVSVEGVEGVAEHGPWDWDTMPAVVVYAVVQQVGDLITPFPSKQDQPPAV